MQSTLKIPRIGRNGNNQAARIVVRHSRLSSSVTWSVGSIRRDLVGVHSFGRRCELSGMRGLVSAWWGRYRMSFGPRATLTNDCRNGSALYITPASVDALVTEIERVYRAAATDLPALAAEGAGNADGEHMIRMFRHPVSAQ